MEKFKSHYDYVIFGGGLSGLVAAYTLSKRGASCLVLEKSPKLGGGNKSFQNTEGDTFDWGYHALDLNRSKTTTEFFTEVLKDSYFEYNLKRGIVLEDTVLAYNSTLDEWPAQLREEIGLESISGNVNDVNSEELERVYGEKFTRYATENVLGSYPSIQWSIEHGGQVNDHLGYIFPWFYPKSDLGVDRKSESESYHDKMRGNEAQKIGYPKSGGFYGFIQGIVDGLDSKVDIVTDFMNNNFKVIYKEGTHEVSHLTYADNKVTGEKYLWCAPVTSFLAPIDSSIRELGVPQKLVLGNFKLKTDKKSDWHEILVGSKNHLINRICFPGKLQNKENNLVQVEFYFPLGQCEYTEKEWEEKWTQSIISLGLIDSKEEIKSFQFKQDFRGFVSKHKFTEMSKIVFSKLENVRTNLDFPFKIVGPENINRIVSGVIEYCEKQ